MNLTNYIEFDDSDYSKLRKRMIKSSEKGSILQRNFLNHVKNSSDFLKYISDEITMVGETDLEPLADKMSEAEFIEPPSDTEFKLFDAWPNISKRVASRPTFWARVVFRHIEEGCIESAYLAAKRGGAQRSGAERIDVALDASGEKANKMIDDCIRSVFRQLSGLPEARGNRSVYVNCPLARGWWRENLVDEVASGDKETEKIVRKTLRVSQDYWEEIVSFVVSRNSVFGSTNIRSEFVRMLGEELESNPNSKLRNKKELKFACRSLSVVQASRELSVLPINELQEIALDIIKTITE